MPEHAKIIRNNTKEENLQHMNAVVNRMLKKDTREPIATSARYFESKS